MTTLCPVCNSEVQSSSAVCPVCGFKLVGATHRFEPITYPSQAAANTTTSIARGFLSVIRGPQIGAQFPLGEGIASIGRNPQCDIFLNDMTVSRAHATIEWTCEGFVLVDQDSFNGVWVNNTTVSSHLLSHGDMIQIGAFSLIFKEE